MKKVNEDTEESTHGDAADDGNRCISADGDR